MANLSKGHSRGLSVLGLRVIFVVAMSASFGALAEETQAKSTAELKADSQFSAIVYRSKLDQNGKNHSRKYRGSFSKRRRRKSLKKERR